MSNPAYTDETLIYFGGDVKASDDGRRVSGYLVRFGDPSTADVQGDYFTANTYFGRAVKAGTDVVWHHGIGRDDLAAMFRNAVIGDADLSLKDDGLWADATIRDVPGTDRLLADVKAGRVGWSSGSVDRLVTRTPVGRATEIKAWPIIEASLSYKPVDPRNKAIACKAMLDDTPDDSRMPSLVGRAEALVADAEAIVAAFKAQADHRRSEGRNLSPAKREAIKALCDTLAELASVTAPAPSPERLAALQRRLLLARIGA